MKPNLMLRAFALAMVFTTLFVLTLGAVLIAFVVGDWIWLQTGLLQLAWGVGVFVMLFFLITLGAGVSLWLWSHGPNPDEEQTPDKLDSLDKILEGMSRGHTVD